jgi:arginase
MPELDPDLLRLIAVPYDSAVRGGRMGAGPLELLRGGAVQRLEAEGWAVQVQTLEDPGAFPGEIATGFRLMGEVAGGVRPALAEGQGVVVLAGNCNASVGVKAAFGPRRLAVLWFDAHGDCETPETTSSGFLDGMGLATLMGGCWGAMAAGVPGFTPVQGRDVVHVGGRALSPAETRFLDQRGARRISVAELRSGGVASSMGEALAAVRDAGASGLIIHLDLDVLDSEAVGPANGFACPGGLHREELLEAVGAAAATMPLVAATMASFDPSCDGSGQVLKAALQALQTIGCGLVRRA